MNRSGSSVERLLAPYEARPGGRAGGRRRRGARARTRCASASAAATAGTTGCGRSSSRWAPRSSRGCGWASGRASRRRTSRTTCCSDFPQEDVLVVQETIGWAADAVECVDRGGRAGGDEPLQRPASARSRGRKGLGSLVDVPRRSERRRKVGALLAPAMALRAGKGLLADDPVGRDPEGGSSEVSDRTYEILFIADPNLGEPEVDALTTVVQGLCGEGRRQASTRSRSGARSAWPTSSTSTVRARTCC